MFRAEGQAQSDAFLQRHPDAVLAADPASPGHLLPLPDNDATALPGTSQAADGFFLALFEKPPFHPSPRPRDPPAAPTSSP